MNTSQNIRLLNTGKEIIINSHHGNSNYNHSKVTSYTHERDKIKKTNNTLC